MRTFLHSQPRWRQLVGVIAAILLVSGSAIVLAAVNSGAVVGGSPSGFESSDGNMTVEGNPAADWNCFANGVSSGFASGVNVGAGTCSSKLIASNAAAIHPDANNGTNGEVAWKSGQKLDASCPILTDGGSVPSKDDFTDVASYDEQDSASPPNTYLYGGEIRSTANGNSSGNLELSQVAGTVACPIVRTAGDFLLAFDFTSGGTVLNFHALAWITAADPSAGGNSGTCDISHDSPPCWGANVITSGTVVNGNVVTVGGCNNTQSPDVEGCSNQAAITAANNGISDAALAPDQFAEFGVNLTKTLGITGCHAFTQQTWESRSSGSSFTSNPEDIEVENQPISNCGSITIIKHTNPPGQSQSFGFTAGGLSPSAFSLSDSCAGNPPANSCTANTEAFGNVSAGSYTVSENAAPNGYQFDNVSCTNNGAPTTSSKVAISGQTVTIALAPNDNIICTYVNDELGTITIIKHTDVRGINQSFPFTSNISSGSASTGTTTSFNLNDKDGTDDTNNTESITDVPAGSYNVTEGTEPSGWTLESLTCTPSTGSSSGTQDGTTAAQADITLAFGGSVTCTFTNKQPLGAITITKESSKAAATPLAGASFQVCTNAGPYTTSNPCAAPSGVTNPLPVTGTNGQTCVAGLTWSGTGTPYYVQEVTAPTGYAPDTSVHTVNVDENATCSTGTEATVTVLDVPLTNLTINASTQVAGGTQSTIACTDGSSNNIGNSPQGLSPSPTVSATGLLPGTYTCTVNVDP